MTLHVKTVFLSPARRGRGILVAPGFCPVSGVTFFVGAKTQKLLVNFFFNFNMTFLATWRCRCASDFFRDATKIQNGRQRSTLIFLWAQKLQNLKSEII